MNHAPTTGGVTIDDQNPWPGLGAFDESAERFFNGRRTERAELRRLILHAPLTVLFAASGLGKTSLLQAGLFPLLRKEHYLPVYVRLDVRDQRAPLIDQVAFALRTECETHGVEAPAWHEQESLWAWLHRAGLELWSAQNQLLTPLFVCDQFEEVFTLGAENAPAIARLRVDLADLIENRLPADLARTIAGDDAAGSSLSLDSQRYKVLLSFREDFLPAVEGWKRELPSILRNRLRLLPMSGDQAFEAVHTTAPHLVDEPLARDIVRFVAAAQEDSGITTSDADGLRELAVEPALLSLVCHGLNEKRKAQGKATFDAALLQGTGRTVIADYYQQAVGDLPEQVQRFIENELITERGFRKPCDVDDARTIHGVKESDLRLLVDRRLLRIEPQRGTDRVELTHDLLTPVVRDHRNRERERARLRRQRKRTLAAVALGSGLLALVILFAWLYVDATRQRAIATDALREAERQTALATARQLATEALYRFDISADGLATSGALAVLSLKSAATVEGIRALSQVLRLIPPAPEIIPHAHGAPIQALTFSRDGRWLATSGRDGVVALWDVAHQMKKTVLDTRFPSAPSGSGLAFSPDGEWLAAGGMGMMLIWRISAVDDPQPQPQQFRHDNLVRSIAFSPNGHLMATATRETNRIRFFEQTDGRWAEVPGKNYPPDLPPFSRINGVSFVAQQRLAVAGNFSAASRHGLWFRRMRDGSDTSLSAGAELGECRALSQSLDWRTLVAFCDRGILCAQRVELRGGDEPNSDYETCTGPQRDIGPFSASYAIAVSGHGEYIAAGDNGGVTHVFANPGGEEVARVTQPSTSVAFRPDAKLLAVGLTDGSIALVPTTKGAASIRLPLSLHVRLLALSPNERWLAAVGIAGTDDAVRIVDITDPRQAHEIQRLAVGPGLGRPRFSPDSRLLAIPDQAGVVLIDTRSWKTLTRYPLAGDVAAIAFTPDSRQLIALDTKGVRRLDTTTFKAIPPMLDGSFRVLKISADGRYLAGFSEKNERGRHHYIRQTTVWEATTGTELAWREEGRDASDDPAGRPPQSGRQDLIDEAKQWSDAAQGSISLNGAWGVDWDTHSQTVELQEANASRTIARLEHDAPVAATAFSPTGRWLATASDDGVVRLWPLQAPDLVSVACKLLPRNLTAEEWNAFKLGGPYQKACPSLP